jgi:hypothetical protein
MTFLSAAQSLFLVALLATALLFAWWSADTDAF